MQFVIGIKLARLLVPEDYGLIGMLAIFMVLSNTFVDSGMGQGLVQKINRTSKAVIPHNERMEIVRNIKFVDSVIPQYDMDKFAMWERLKFDVMFVGDDWFKTPKWEELDEKFKSVGVKIIYFPYIKGTSSTIINKTLDDLRL